MRTNKEKHTPLPPVMLLVALMKYRRAQSSQPGKECTGQPSRSRELDTMISSKLFLVLFNDSFLMHTSLNFVDADNSLKCDVRAATLMLLILLSEW